MLSLVITKKEIAKLYQNISKNLNSHMIFKIIILGKHLKMSKKSRGIN